MATFFVYGSDSKESMDGIDALRTETEKKLIQDAGGETVGICTRLGSTDLVLNVELLDIEAAAKNSLGPNHLTGTRFQFPHRLRCRPFTTCSSSPPSRWCRFTRLRTPHRRLTCGGPRKIKSTCRRPRCSEEGPLSVARAAFQGGATRQLRQEVLHCEVQAGQLHAAHGLVEGLLPLDLKRGCESRKERV